MLRDVFYYGKKPNVHPRERFAKNIADARNQSTTQDFWIINEFCDYTNFEWDFDFDFLPDDDVWAQEHNNVWPSVYQKDSGTWLCNKGPSEVIIYRNDVSPLKRKKERSDNWIVHYKIDEQKFDFGWHPDPSSPPYIYVWGNQWIPGKTAPTVEYRVPGATQVKHMDTIAFVVADMSKWDILESVDLYSFDFSWMPDPSAPPYVYVWGNQWNSAEDKASLRYVVEGATENKYMSNKVKRLPDLTNWQIPDNVDASSFDFSWEPNPHEPKYIYQFGTQWQRTGGPRYVVPDATEIKYVEKKSLRVKRLPDKTNWIIPDYIDQDTFDFSWHPDESSPAYLYHFGTQWNDRGGPTYLVSGATETNYVNDITAKTKPSEANWLIPDNIDKSSFDFSWVPHPDDPPYLYQFGTQWQKTNGPRYIVRNAAEIKYVNVLNAKRLSDMSRWQVPSNINVKDFDFSWHPDDTEPDYIYEFGTQWQKTGGPRYVPESITILGNKKALGEYKYIDVQKAIKLPEPDKFNTLVNNKILDFDYSWHPDDTEPPYIYQFGNDQYHAEIMPTIEYHVPTATTIKYVEDVVAKLGPSLDNWYIPDNVDVEHFDFSWLPNPKDPPYIYQFGTQWQKTGGPRYVVPGASEYKYIDTIVVKALPTKKNWHIPDNVDVTDFDFSWHPDPLSPPYIYHFGTQWQETGGPVYKVEGATQVKYVSDTKVKALPTKKNWKIPKEIDISEFDFSWHPSALDDDPYIYQFGTQWQKTGGPRYVVPGAKKNSPVKYVTDQRVKKLPNKKKFTTLYGYKIENFDYSWHPDDTDEPYIYVFGNNWWGAETMPTIEYRIDGATKRKYINEVVAKLGQDKTFWLLPDNIDAEGFDFSWKPNPFEPAYIYKFGTQWQKTGGPEYWTPDANDVKYMDFQKVKALSNKKDKRWQVPENIDISDFDFSWHPDETSPKYIYQFGTQWAMTGGPRYVVEGATEIKYMDDPIARALPNRENWVVPADVDAESFDYSWHPYIEDKPYIYVFGTQHQKTGGPKYMTPGVDGTSATKYIDRRVLQAKRLPNKKRFSILFDCKIKDFDFSWHPDDRDDPYIYHFGSNHYPPEVMPAIEYRVAGAKSIKYVHDRHAVLDVDMTNWVIPDNIKVPDDFDFSWRPNPRDPEYIYEFGTQWQKTGGPRYVVEGATEIKYIENKNALALPTTECWEIVDGIKIKDFDFSWHPDRTEEPYIYVFGNNLYPGEIMPTVRYIVPGATQVKYIADVLATLAPNKDNWLIPDDIELGDFDFRWMPNPLDPPYIYEFGTQWQKTGGPRYIVKKATDTKYVDSAKVKRLPNRTYHWVIEGNNKIKDFDYSWHPDSSEEPYIYVFGNNLYPGEIMPTIKYIVPGASQVKYVSDIIATLAPNKSNWNIPEDVDVTGFDFAWVPNPMDPPYIYEFGTQWQKTGGPRYIVPGAQEVKYIDTQKVKRLPRKSECWVVEDGIKIKDFDYSWHPDSTDDPFIYVFGNTLHPAEVMPTIKYVVPNATAIKYVHDIKVTLGINMNNWIISPHVDTKDFDFSWLPDPTSPPYIYEFGTQWQKTGGPRYIVKNAKEIKYVEGAKAKALPNINEHWQEVDNISVASFDYSWHPDSTEEPYIYVFGNELYGPEKMPTLKYVVPRASQIKYIEEPKAKLKPSKKHWNLLLDVKLVDFDYSWVPDPNDPAYIYVFGNQWNTAEKEPTIEYRVPGATEKKYIKDIVANIAPSMKGWNILYPIDETKFDFSWRPDPNDPAYIYIFGNQWNKAEVEQTVKYTISGATDKKFINDIVPIALPDMSRWVIPENINVDNFDFSWRPNPGSPPYIYQFGTISNDEDGPRYEHPDHKGEIVKLKRVEKERVQEQLANKYYITTTLEDLANEHTDELFWALNPDIDYTEFDFNWRPSIEQARYVHAFGSADNINTQTYFVNGPQWARGNRDLNYVEDKDAKLKVIVDMFFVDKGNTESNDRFNKLKTRYGDKIQKTRYLNSWVDTINRCINRASTNLCWILNSELDYTNFNFDYYPNPWQAKMVHVFGTQWSHWGTTFMVNRESFPTDTKWIKIIEHLSNLNFVKDRKAKATNNLYDIILIDHGNRETISVKKMLEGKANGKTVNVVPYKDSYFDTLKTLVKGMNPKKEHYIWICSSICNYNSFDFSYICDPFAKDNLHVFATGRQKFGDTFLIDVNKTLEIIDSIDTLQAYHKVNYSNQFNVHRLPAPVIYTEDDTHMSSIKEDFEFPYAIFMTEEVEAADTEPMSLWTEETKNIMITSTGGTRIIVPREAKDYVKDQLYDYPYIKTASKLAGSKPLDIVFLSNGEKCAEENYEHLLSVTKGLKNRITRIDGIDGRVAAYHAAVTASNTPWAFTVFAKLKVNPKFDWGWQPDRLQIPKHYIFHAKNPINGLEYGHQGMIAYNKKLTLANTGLGLDFTLDDPHETVAILSGIATFNTDAYSTWRTAFREVIKLKSDYEDISQKRLEVWSNKAEGKYAESCLQGANDAVEYYDSVSGDIDKLKLSYEWAWLQKYYRKKYK